MSQGPGLAEALRREIIAGSLEPGVRLRQGEIGDRYGVSRTPVREALQKLHAWGLVELAANRSAIVRPLRRRDFEGAFIVRAELEALAVELAVPKLTAAHTDALRGAVKLFEDVVRHTVESQLRRSWSEERSGATWTEADELFHATIVEAAGSSRLRVTVELASGLVSRRRLWEALGCSSSRVRATCGYHRAILERLEANDAGAASATMRQHILEEADAFLEWFDRVEAEGHESMPSGVQRR